MTPRTGRARVRDLGLRIGVLPTGANNAITDVPGVLVGQVSVVRPGVRTGVTAIRPHPGDVFDDPVRAGFFHGNGMGKFIGATQILERGQLETPIVLTGTLSAFLAAHALAEWVLEQPGHEQVRSVNPVVGETNDHYWRATGHRAGITADDVRTALADATGGPVAEGNVGAGTGTLALGYKGGIGTASRTVEVESGGYTVGALVQTNFGGRLRVGGVPVERSLVVEPDVPGSIIVLVATDAPADSRQLNRLAKRGIYALAVNGSSYHELSGDYALAFSTARVTDPRQLREPELSGFSVAVLEAVEESVLNALTSAESAEGLDGFSARAIDLDEFVAFCRHHRLIPD